MMRVRLRTAYSLHSVCVLSLLGIAACVTTRSRGPVPATSPVHAWVPGAPDTPFAIVDVTVVPMDTERLLPHTTVLLQHGWISAMGPTTQLPVPPGTFRIDGRGKYLLPGFADMHAHLMANSNILSTRTVDSAEAARRLFLWVANGVTTIRNMDYDAMPPGGLAWKHRAATGTILSPQIYTSGPLGITDRTPPTEIASDIAAYQAAGYDFIKMHTPPLPGRFVDSIAAAAHRMNIPFAGHVLDSVSVVHAIQLGYASIEHLDGYLQYLRRPPNPADSQPSTRDVPALAAWQTRQFDLAKLPAIVMLAKQAQVWNCPTEVAVERTALDVSAAMLTQEPERKYYSPSGAAFWTMMKGPGVSAGEATSGLMMLQAGGALTVRRQLIKAMQEAGVGLLLGTDAPTLLLVPGFSIHRELEALVHAGLTPYQALVTGTRNPAQFFDRLATSGTVAVGKRADLVLLDGNPLTDIAQTGRISGVFLGGRWLPRADIDRRLSTSIAPPDAP